LYGFDHPQKNIEGNIQFNKSCSGPRFLSLPPSSPRSSCVVSVVYDFTMAKKKSVKLAAESRKRARSESTESNQTSSDSGREHKTGSPVTSTSPSASGAGNKKKRKTKGKSVGVTGVGTLYRPPKMVLFAPTFSTSPFFRGVEKKKGPLGTPWACGCHNGGTWGVGAGFHATSTHHAWCVEHGALFFVVGVTFFFQFSRD
jgi:hypothetical protein